MGAPHISYRIHGILQQPVVVQVTTDTLDEDYDLPRLRKSTYKLYWATHDLTSIDKRGK